MDKAKRTVYLLDHELVFRLKAEDRHVYIEMFGTWFLFEPFLDIDWLRRLLNLR